MGKELQIIENALADYIQMRADFGETTTPRDFDNWIAGYILGTSLLTQNDVQKFEELIEALLLTPIVKDVIGVTGTLKERFEVKKY